MFHPVANRRTVSRRAFEYHVLMKCKILLGKEGCERLVFGAASESGLSILEGNLMEITLRYIPDV